MNTDLVWLEPQSPEQIMDEAIKEYKLNKLYVLFSGGKDSVCVAHYIATNYSKQFAGCVFTNTGLAAKDTRKFVISYCREMNWKLYLTYPSDKERLYNIIMREVFARQGNHRLVMGYIKYHSWYYFLREKILQGEKAAFISGLRKKESQIRNKMRQFTKHPVDKRGRFELFIKPFLYKNAGQLWEYFNHYELKKTPVYSWLNKSGECLCGSFTEPWELKMLEKYDPGSFETIKWLEKQLQLHGTDKAKRFSKWGVRGQNLGNPYGVHGSYTKEVEDQTAIDDYCGESCAVY